MSTLIKTANVTFSSKVQFISDAEVKETMDNWGLETVDQLAEELDAVGYTSVRLHEENGIKCEKEGYLFFY